VRAVHRPHSTFAEDVAQFVSAEPLGVHLGRVTGDREGGKDWREQRCSATRDVRGARFVVSSDELARGRQTGLVRSR
jgi:hypothetical protein